MPESRRERTRHFRSRNAEPSIGLTCQLTIDPGGAAIPLYHNELTKGIRLWDPLHQHPTLLQNAPLLKSSAECREVSGVKLLFHLRCYSCLHFQRHQSLHRYHRSFRPCGSSADLDPDLQVDTISAITTASGISLPTSNRSDPQAASRCHREGQRRRRGSREGVGCWTDRAGAAGSKG
jgi:hypothetical protein